VVLAGMAFLNFTSPAYGCSNTWAPTAAPTTAAAPTATPATGPAKSPAASATVPPIGYVQPDMGHVHVTPGTFVKYQNCPPASGKHYPAPGGPIRPGLYGPNDSTIPQGWVHNMEHGGLVILYKCPGPGCTDEGQAALKALYAAFPNSPQCNLAPGIVGPVFARFDQMDSPYMALVWDMTLPMDTLDTDQVKQFFARNAEQFNPEKQCAAPTASPGPTPTAGPSSTAGPASGAPTSAPTAAPASGSPSPS